MRRGLSGMAWVVVALGCSPTLTPFNEPLTPPPAREPSDAVPAPDDHDPTPYAQQILTEKIVAYAKRFCRRHGAADVAADYAPDAVVRAADGGRVRGVEAIARAEKWDDLFAQGAECPGPQVFIRGGTAVFLSSVAGANTGAVGRFEPTGRRVGVMIATVDVFTPDGKIIEEREYVDAPTIFAQLGLYAPERRPVLVPNWVLECHIATGALEERANARLAKQMQRAFDQRDAAAYAATLDDDVVWDDFTALAPTRGKGEVVKRFTAQAGAFSRAFLDCDVRGVVDYVVSECTLTGVQTGPLAVAGLRVAPTNRDVTVHSLEILQIRGGRVLRGWTYGNGAEVARELGAWTPPSPPDPGDAGGALDAAPPG